MKIYAALNIQTGHIETLKLAKGKSMPFPFRHLEGEKGWQRFIRRLLWKWTLKLSGDFTDDEIHGRNPLQARASEAFENKRPLENMPIQNTENPIVSQGIIVAINEDLGNKNEWRITRWSRQLCNKVLGVIEGKFPRYKEPKYFSEQSIQPQTLSLNKIFLKKSASEMLNTDPILVVEEGNYGITAVKEIYANINQYVCTSSGIPFIRTVVEEELDEQKSSLNLHLLQQTANDNKDNESGSDLELSEDQSLLGGGAYKRHLQSTTIALNVPTISDNDPQVASNTTKKGVNLK